VRLTVRAATHDDLPTVHEILDDAAAWLAERGIQQWPVPYPREPTERALAERGLWVVCRAGRTVATMRTARRDPDVWGDDAFPALYVHALAVRREAPARGSGLGLLRWAARTAGRRASRRFASIAWRGTTAYAATTSRSGSGTSAMWSRASGPDAGGAACSRSLSRADRRARRGCGPDQRWRNRGAAGGTSVLTSLTASKAATKDMIQPLLAEVVDKF
jgi:hypothetical protein